MSDCEQELPRILLLIPTTSYRTKAFMSAATDLQLDLVVGTDKLKTLANQTPGKTFMFDFRHPQTAVTQILKIAEGIHA